MISYSDPVRTSHVRTNHNPASASQVPLGFLILGAYMPTVTVSDDQGQLVVTVDGGQPVPVKSAEEACAIVEQTFGAPAPAEQGPMGEDYMAGIGAAKSGMM
jgi:hypothetical protein